MKPLHGYLVRCILKRFHRQHNRYNCCQRSKKQNKTKSKYKVSLCASVRKMQESELMHETTVTVSSLTGFPPTVRAWLGVYSTGIPIRRTPHAADNNPVIRGMRAAGARTEQFTLSRAPLGSDANVEQAVFLERFLRRSDARRAASSRRCSPARVGR